MNCEVFNLKSAINIPTRGNNTLDQMLQFFIYFLDTNLKFFYNPADSGPPFGLSDHVTIPGKTAKSTTPEKDDKSA